MLLKCYQFNHNLCINTQVIWRYLFFPNLESLFYFVPFKNRVRSIDHNYQLFCILFIYISIFIYIYNYIYIYIWVLFSLYPYLYHSANFYYSSNTILLNLIFNLTETLSYYHESLSYYHESINWEGIIINKTIPISQITNLPLYLSLTPILIDNNPNIKKLQSIIFTILNIIKTNLIFIIFLLKFFSLIEINILTINFDLIMCGHYIVVKTLFVDSFVFNFISYFLLLDNNTNLYILVVLINLIILIIINIMTIFIIMLNYYSNNLYKIYFIIRIKFSVINLMQLIKWFKFCGFIFVNILKLLNSGLSPEDLLILFSYNKNIESFLPTNIMQTFMDKESQNKLITKFDISKPSSSHQSLIYSNYNKDNLIENYLENIDTSEGDKSESDTSNNIEINLNNNINNINFNNFNLELNLEDKHKYLIDKFYNKGIDSNLPLLDWFIKLLVKSDGSKNNIDKLIETNLNHILKIEREAQLNHYGFFRNKPFLINKTDNSPIAIPSIIPVFKGISNYGEEEI